MKWGLPISISLLFWTLIGIIRYVNEKINKKNEHIIYENSSLHQKRVDQVAVCIAAKNEEEVLDGTIKAIKKMLPVKNCYVVSDGSDDATELIAKKYKVNLLAFKKSHGKGEALELLIKKYDLLKKFKFILFVDADTKINKHYINNALELFRDPQIACIAGFAKNQWRQHDGIDWKYFFIGYRTRLYSILQLLMVYGQTWKFLNVTSIAPGFASIYRTSVLKKLKINVPDLIIEDFNLAFQIRKKKLGLIAHHPSIFGTAQDPTNMSDYIKQVERWNLGFFQTVKKYKIWISLFWLALGIFIVEGFISAVFFLSIPIIIATLFFVVLQPLTNIWLVEIDISTLNTLIMLSEIIIGVTVADYLLTIFIAIRDKKYKLLLYGVGFAVFRYIDALILITTAPKAFFIKSNGTWTSPKRS